MKIRIFLSLILVVQFSYADKVCLKSTIKRSKITNLRKVVPSTSRCPVGYQEIINTATLSGAPGANGINGSNGTNGVNGTDGSIKVWGDGSDGDITLVHGNFIDSTKQYRNITITSGDLIYAVTGTTIRCSGTITVNGTIAIQSGSFGSTILTSKMNSNSYYPPFISGTKKNILLSNASFPEVVNGASEASGGESADSPVDLLPYLKNIRKVDHQTTGSAGTGNLGGFPGAAGGSIAIYCKNGINVPASGRITANGYSASDGAGAGSGGIIILASNGSILNQGSIEAIGGSSSSATPVSGEGGAGGGGLIHIIAPAITAGTTNVSAGFSTGLTSPPGTVTGTLRSGGGAGGSCAGRGGSGATVNPDGSTNGSGVAGAGQVIITQTISNDVAPLIM